MSSASATVTAAIGRGESRTTVLAPGTVESRNATNRSQISAEIASFLSGTDGNQAAMGFRSEFRTFFTIWMFITRLPSPSCVDIHPGFLMRGMSYFPVVGSVLGVMYSILYDFLHLSLGLSSTVAAAVTISSGLHVSGCFHEDGLSDSADGIGGGWTKSQILKIMTDSRLGTFGCAALCMFLCTKMHLWGQLGSEAGAAIIVAQTLSRLSAPYLIRTRDYIAEVGPKSPFYIFMVEAKYLVSWMRVICACTYSFTIASIFYGPTFAAVLIVAVLVMSHFAGNQGDYLLGGVMGDYLGGTICMCEILILVLIVSKESVIELYSSAVETISSIDEPVRLTFPHPLFTELYSNDRVRPVLHCAMLAMAFKLWCANVGSPDMYDREDDKDDSRKDKAE